MQSNRYIDITHFTLYTRRNKVYESSSFSVYLYVFSCDFITNNNRAIGSSDTLVCITLLTRF